MSADAWLDVVPMPFIVSPPLSTNVPLGGEAVFKVVPGGVSPFSFQWLFNGQPMPAATNNYLWINVQTSSQAGDYSVVASNAVGVVTSAVGRLLWKNQRRSSPVVAR